MADIGLSLNISDVKKLDTRQRIKLKENFVKNLTGTSMEEILMVTLLQGLLIFLTVSLKLWILSKLNINLNKAKSNKRLSTIFFFMMEFFTLVLPIVLQLTVFSDISVFVLVFTITTSLFVITFAVSSIHLNVLYWRIPHFKGEFLNHKIGLTTEKQVYITYFRSIVLLATSISILAVDFHVFPRRFAKTEKYGVSLMDMGVGLYIMSNAIVTKVDVASQKWKHIFSDTWLILSFGVVRCVLMEQIDYQKHITEYGTHWNFFITLGLVKFVSSVIQKMFRGHILECAFVLLFVHECLLRFSLEQFVMSDLGRENWVYANREGIVSLLGYLSLYLIGLSTKRVIGTVDRYTRHMTTKRKLTVIGHLILSFSFLFYITKLLSGTIHVSRRLANLPYVLWITTICFEQLITGMIVELASFCFLPINANNRHNMYSLLVPDLLESINNNAFLFFIISNVLTGCVNLSVDVLSMETVGSMSVLLTYTFVICAVVYILHVSNVRIKF